ncbi:MAG TPA: M56 family metallopeptidase [Gemmatimonadales bacterium]|nr:M56 family metallopeptidase [Gemmatimonadales bacterium]
MITLVSGFLVAQAPAFASALFEGTLKGSVILASAAALTSAMRGRSAAARHLVWRIALFSAALMPLATQLLPAWRVAIPAGIQAVSSLTVVRELSVPAIAPEMRAPLISADRRAGATAGAVTGHSPLPAANQPLPTLLAPLSLATSLMLGWLLGATLLFTRLLASLVTVARLTRRAEPVVDPAWRTLLNDSARSLGLNRVARLLASEETGVPMTWGVVRPVVLLTPEYDEWSAERRRSVMRHELAHVARWDAATQLAAQACCALYWFNPLVWIAARTLRSEAERACDDRVLAAGTRASDYASELLDIARAAPNAERNGVALAMARRSQLEGRLLSILAPRARRDAPGALSVAMFGLAALVLTVPLAAFRAATAATPAPLGEAEYQQPIRAGNVVRPTISPSTIAITPRAELTEPRCVGGSHDSSHSSSNMSLSDGSDRTWRVSWSGEGCSVDLRARGNIKFSDDFSDVTGISGGGYVEINVRDGGTTRRLEIRPEGGGLQRTHTVNGRTAPFDEEARSWLAGLLVEVDRHTGFAVDVRFPALLSKGGTSAVLDEIEHMSSDYPRGLYYRKLLAGARLTPADVRRVARAAGAQMTSDYELGGVLGALADRYALDDAEVRSAFMDGAGKLKSDYERSQLLLTIINKGAFTGGPANSRVRGAGSAAGGANVSVNPEAARTIAKLAGGMDSDYEKSRVLLALGDSRLFDPKTMGAEYFDAVGTVKSDYERGRVLQKILDAGQLPAESLIRVLDLTRQMNSDYEAAGVLVEFASHNKVDGNVRDAFLATANHLGSDYERQRAIGALAKGVK